jgi:hypothetical protein
MLLLIAVRAKPAGSASFPSVSKTLDILIVEFEKNEDVDSRAR